MKKIAFSFSELALRALYQYVREANRGYLKDEQYGVLPAPAKYEILLIASRHGAEADFLAKLQAFLEAPFGLSSSDVELTKTKAAQRLKISLPTFRDLERKGVLPKPIGNGRRRSSYSQNALDAWVLSSRTSP